MCYATLQLLALPALVHCPTVTRAHAAQEQPLPRAPLLPACSPCPVRPCCLRAAPALRAIAACEQPLPRAPLLPTSSPCPARPYRLRAALAPARPVCRVASAGFAPCCSPHVAPCCPACRALLQPARRALLLRASCPNAARASFSSAPCVAPYCSPRVAPCCPASRALLQPAIPALLPCTACALLPAPPRPSLTVQPEPPSCYYYCCCCCCSCYCCCWWKCCWECWRCRRPAPPSRPAATTPATAARATVAAGGGAARSAGGAAGAGGAGGAAGSTGGAAGAGGAGPTTDRHCVSWQLSRQLQQLGVDSSGHCLSKTTPPLSSFRCVPGSVEAAALGSSESAAAPRAGESTAALGARESADALGASASTATGPASAEALHTFTLDSGASCCFFRDCTTVTPLAALVPVLLADPTGGPVVARASTVLLCPVVPSGSLSRLHLPAFLTNFMHSLLLVSGLPRSLPSLPRSPTQQCLPCVEGQQRAAPHSSEFPPTTAPLQTLHMDVWGPAPIGGTDQEHYFLLLRERFHRDFPVLRLHSDTGGEFSSDLLAEFCRDEGMRQSFTLLASPQQNGIAEHCIGLVLEVARTSMIHAAAPHFLWPFAVRYAAHQLNLWPLVSKPDTSPTIRPGGGGYGPAGAGAASPGGTAGAGATSPRGAIGAGGAGPTCRGGTAGAGGARGAASTGGTGAGGSGGARTAGPGGARTRGAGAAGAGGTAGARGAGARGTGGNGCAAAADPGGARTRGAGAAGAGGARGAGGATGAAGTGGAGGTAGARGAGTAGARGAAGVGGATGATSAGGAGAAGAGGAGANDQSQPQLLPGSPLPAPAPYTEVTESLTERCEPRTRASTPIRAGHVARPRPPADPGTHGMALLASLVTESKSVCPPSVGGEPALRSDVLEDSQFEFECLATTLPCFASMLFCLEEDPHALDIPHPRSYVEAIAGDYSSQRQTAMDAEMASWKSTGTYVDEVPPPGANIVDGMWIFRVKRPPGSLPAFKARYVARGFSSLHEEIWLRRPLGFTGSFPAGTQWSLWRPVYGLRQAPREWHDTLRTTLATLGFAPSSADPSLFLRTDTTLPSFYVLVYVDDLVFATADTKAMALVKAELQERHTCTDLGPSALRLPVLLSIAHSSVYRPLALSSTFGRVLHRALGLVLGGRGSVVLTGHSDASWADDQANQRSSQGYTFSLGSGSFSWRSTHSSSVLGSSYEAEIYARAMAAQELHWLTYLLTDLGERPCSPPVLYANNKAMLALCREQRLEQRTKHIAMRYFLARELQQRRQLRLSYVASRAITVDVVTKALGSGDHLRFCNALGLVPTLPHLLVA
ncbi:unnamed protein product [Closterium sp. NIES-53]